MPELPEVETTRRGIAPLVVGHLVVDVAVREARLRWPVAADLAARVRGQRVNAVSRRSKYLLIEFAQGTLIVHLGMSGSLRVVAADAPPGKSDHLDVVLDNGDCLRLCDPRRFGAVLWAADPAHHPLLRDIGPEPLEAAFSADYLFYVSRKRKRAIKDFLMDSHVVAGVGNIYANEALFAAGIDPRRAAGRLSRARYAQLQTAIVATLNAAIAAGGTTLRDFRGADGRPGYFSHALQVYGRAGEPCRRCGTVIRHVTIGSRSAFFCRSCQS